MTTSRKNPKVDTFLRQEKKWPEEMKKLRSILLGFPLSEELKWGKPCYMSSGANVVLILGLKETCDLLFAKGALLKDPKRLLYRPSENTQAQRRLQFTSLAQIVKLEAVVKSYVREAMEVEKSGLEVSYKEPAKQAVPGEFQKKLDQDTALKKAFNALTPGRQRAYLLHFAAPKQSATRNSRIEKCRSQILKGIGLNDEYQSKRKPAKSS